MANPGSPAPDPPLTVQDRSRTIVVSGLPRSGTSLLMAMLRAGGVPLFTDSLRTADDSNPHGYFEYEPVKRLTPDAPWLTWTAGHAIKIVIPLVRRLPPDFPCDVLLLERAMPEILASQAAMLSRCGMPVVDPRLLGPAFERELRSTHETLASRPDCRVLTLRHRDLLSRPFEASEETARFLRMPLDPAAMAAVVEPTLHRQREESL
ncbi:MAG: sulfotransferase family protein [Verrucomicrobiaceae bacterium]|nr:MAG: sulfotransferase family protein [Verrucomicrobiaceae bacterium]